MIYKHLIVYICNTNKLKKLHNEKLLLVAAFGAAGLVSAKSTETKNIKTESIKETELKIDVAKSTNTLLKREIIRVTTICGATYVTVSGPVEVLQAEWEDMNQELCGHHSYENPVT